MGNKATTVVIHYHVRPGRQESFLQLLAQHWVRLWHAGLVTEETAQYFAGPEAPGQPSTVYEIFTWVSPQSAATAHARPEISRLWRDMAALCEGDGRPVTTAVRQLELA